MLPRRVSITLLVCIVVLLDTVVASHSNCSLGNLSKSARSFSMCHTPFELASEVHLRTVFRNLQTHLGGDLWIQKCAVSTRPKNPIACPTTVDLIILILAFETSGQKEFRDILEMIVNPCNLAGNGLSNITFITSVTKGTFSSNTFHFNGLPQDNFYAGFGEDYDASSDILGAINHTLAERTRVMNDGIPYRTAIYVMTYIRCVDIFREYPNTMKMLNSPDTLILMENLTIPVRIFLTKSPDSENDNVTFCNLDKFKNESQGILDFELSVSSDDSELENNYGLCEPPNVTSTVPSTTRSSTRTTTTTRTSTSVRSTTTGFKTVWPTTRHIDVGTTTTLHGQSTGSTQTTTTPQTTVTSSSPRPPSNTEKPKPKNHVLAWVLGSVGVAILICSAGVARRIFFPQFRLCYREKEPDNDVWEVIPNQLLITEQRLGSGAYAVVHKAVLSGVPPVYKKFPALQLANILSDTENVVAAKTPKKHATLEERLEFLQEVEFMKRLDYYPHLLSMIGCSSSVQYPVLLTEYCALGDLLHLVRALDGSSEAPQISFGDLVPICWQMSDALAYLCVRKIIHRDVAARNVLVTTDKMAKLSDFGLCRTDEQMMYTTRGGKLPIKWMAPESLDYAVFSAKTDVWSYGILLYEVFSFGKTPFITVDADVLAEHLRKGNRLNIPERTPPKVSDLMHECWMERPEDRPDITVIRENLYSMMEAESDGYGYLTFSKNYYDVFKKKLHNIDEVYEV